MAAGSFTWFFRVIPSKSFSLQMIICQQLGGIYGFVWWTFFSPRLLLLFQEIVVNAGDIMCNSYGSHVLRRLLCICKGVSIDIPEFHSTKPSFVLAERLNMRSSKLENNDLQQHQSFPHQLTSLMSEMLNPLRVDIATIQLNQYSSLVLQVCLSCSYNIFHPIIL